MCVRQKQAWKNPDIRLPDGHTKLIWADAHQTGGTLTVLLGYGHRLEGTPGKMTRNYFA